jgi:hypothetical protein
MPVCFYPIRVLGVIPDLYSSSPEEIFRTKSAFIDPQYPLRKISVIRDSEALRSLSWF